MHGLVTVLEGVHEERVRQLWAGLRRRFGVGSSAVVHFPHFSYHVAEAYDFERVTAVLRHIAAQTAPFTVNATGVGIFSGEEPVLYVPVARSRALDALHTNVWTAVDSLSRNSVAYYAPDGWFPHITLGHDDVTAENLGAIVAWLNEQPLTWSIPVNNIAVLQEAGEGITLRTRIPLQKEAD